MVQREIKDNAYAKFRGGGGVIKCIMIDVRILNLKRLLFSRGFNPQKISLDLQWVIDIKNN